MKDQAVKEKFIELRAGGFSYQSIAQQLAVSKQTLIRWSQELKYDIANHQTIHKEALREKYHLTCAAKIESLGLLLERVKAEVAKRDLSAIPTDKLIRLMMELNAQCNASDLIVFQEEQGMSEMAMTCTERWAG